jgi:hypothetical protein
MDLDSDDDTVETTTSVVPYSLNGTWVPISENLEAGPTVELKDCEVFMGMDKYGCKFRNESRISIRQVSRLKEEVLLTYKNNTEEQFFPYVLEEINIIECPSM